MPSTMRPDQMVRILKRIRARAAAALPHQRQPGEGRDNVHACTIRDVGKILKLLATKPLDDAS